jgi:hypothetical protein
MTQSEITTGVQAATTTGVAGDKGVFDRFGKSISRSNFIVKRSFISRMRDVAIRYLNTTYASHDHLSELVTFLQHEAWQRALLAVPYDNPKRLARFGYKAYSQSDEDGIIAEIFNRIGTETQIFFEFGVGDGLANNTVNLLIDGWSGFWIDGSTEFIEKIRDKHRWYIEKGRLNVLSALITKDSINKQIVQMDIPHSIDLLSIDIDGNDYWIWEAIDSISPRVIVIEYNSTHRPPTSVVMEYGETNQWNGTNYFGASLNALVKLGQSKGYSLVGCNFTGVNAFFVRNDLLGDHFLAPFTAETHYEPPRYTALRGGHPAGIGPYRQI